MKSFLSILGSQFLFAVAVAAVMAGGFLLLKFLDSQVGPWWAVGCYSSLVLVVASWAQWWQQKEK